MRTEHSLRTTGLGKKFGDFTAVEDLTLEVKPGEHLCLLGPSGCGKSTTLRMLAGLEDPSSGRVEIGGRDVTHLDPNARNVAMAFQFYALYPTLTVAENLAFPLRAEGLSRSEIRTRVDAILDTLAITGVLDKYPEQLSEGDKQRVAVGRCIIRTADALLFDEPLSRLDAGIRVRLRTEIKEILVNLAKPTVIVTHDQEEAITMGDRIAIMRDGALQQVGDPLEVFRDPINRFVAEFIGMPAINMIDGSFQLVDGIPSLIKGSARLALGRMPESVAPGAPIAFGIRPRALTLGGDAASGITISGRIELLEPTGPETLYHVTTDFGEIRLLSNLVLEVGQNVIMRVPEDEIVLFNGDGNKC